MITTTRQKEYVTGEDTLLYINGEVNQEVHSKLHKIVHNIARSYANKNPSISADDLEQDAWLKILETVRAKKEDRYRDIKYLVIVAKNAILGKCMDISKDRDNIDDFSSMLISSMDAQTSDGNSNTLNVAKANLEYRLQLNHTQEDDASILRISFEDVVENITVVGKQMDTYKIACKTLSKHEQEVFLLKVQMLIVIRYIKEVNGDSKKIRKIYDAYYDSLIPERRRILDTMDKFTNNAAFRVLGMRATDNPTKLIRAGVKEALSILYND